MMAWRKSAVHILLTTVLFHISPLLCAQDSLIPIDTSGSLVCSWSKCRTKVPISFDRELLGVTAITESNEPSPNSLYVLIPEHTSTRLWVDIVTQEGGCTWHMEYDIAASAPGVYRLVFLQKNKEAVSDYFFEEFGVFATLRDSHEHSGMDTSRTGAGIVITSWNPIEQADSLILQINGGGATKSWLSILGTKNPDFPLRFWPNESMRPTTYITDVCRVPVTAELRSGSIVIGRRQFSMPYPILYLPLEFP